MKGSKVGLADLKRLKKDLEAERQRATLARASAAAAARKPAAESANPADDAEALRRSLRSVTPIKRDARVEHKPVAAPRRPCAAPTRWARPRPAPTPACPTAAKSSTCCPKAAPPSCAATPRPTRRATCVAASGARAPNSTCTACA